MRRTILAAVIAAAFVVPMEARANHAGCLATTAAPVCTYTAVGPHQAISLTSDGFEAWVTRTIDGEETKVVVGSAGGGDDVLVDVNANSGELVTVEINAGDNGPVGIVSSGNTAGHLP